MITDQIRLAYRNAVVGEKGKNYVQTWSMIVVNTFKRYVKYCVLHDIDGTFFANCRLLQLG